MHLPPANALSKQKRAMCYVRRKPYELKVGYYSARLIDLNEQLSTFPGAKESDNISEMELNQILLNSIPNGWSK